jgi:hypothetical protein
MTAQKVDGAPLSLVYRISSNSKTFLMPPSQNQTSLAGSPIGMIFLEKIAVKSTWEAFLAPKLHAEAGKGIGQGETEI